MPQRKHNARNTPQENTPSSYTALQKQTCLFFFASSLSGSTSRAILPGLNRRPTSNRQQATGNRQHAARWSDQQNNNSNNKTKNASFHRLRWPRLALAKSDPSQVAETSVAGALARVLQDQYRPFLASYCFLLLSIVSNPHHTRPHKTNATPTTNYQKQPTEANVSTRDVTLYRTMTSDTGATARWAHATVPPVGAN